MDKLLPEILCKIFLMVCQANHEYSMSRLRGPRTFSCAHPFPISILPLLYITHVCRAWRGIALSYGCLWAYMCIEFRGNFDEGKLAMTKEVFGIWLLRTGGSPLNIALDCDELLSEKVQGVVEHLVKALIDQQHRWKDMWIYCFLIGRSKVLPEIITLNNMPLLTSLDVYMYAFSHRFVVDISGCLHLQQLRLRSADVLISDKPIQMLRKPSSVIFDKDPVSMRMCLSFLRAAPYLKNFRVSFRAPLFDEPDSDHPHLSHQLETLDANVAMVFINSFTLPSLKALRYYRSDLSRIDERILWFIQRSMPPLTFLEVRYICDDILLGILRLVPTLLDLRVHNGIFTEHFFRELLVSDVPDGDECVTGSAIMCPGLVSLYLTCPLNLTDEDEVDICIRSLIDMIYSRHENLNTFRKVRLGEDVLDVAEMDQHYEQLSEFLIGDKVIIQGHNVPPDPFQFLR